MKHNTPKTILWLLALFFAVTGCRQEDIQLPEEPNVKGRIVLAFSNIEVYTDDAVTRSSTLDNYTGFVFTLNGTTVDGWTVRDSVVSFLNNEAIIEAGTYRLSANNDAASAPANGKGCANYSGQSGEFSLSIGGTTTVTIGSDQDPLTPKNARITIEQDDSFSSLYNNVRVTLTAGGRSVDLGNTTGCEAEAFFPAGTVNYTITAEARSGSHVTDINSAAGNLTLTAGKHHIISLTANPVTGEIIPLIEGTHTGEFD